ncbi:hypothetical protein SAMN04487917_11535 [Arthrobacter sp. yr096]|uniref:hypothetical protein n=1 Tax=unclassified Arthrobacter TaxID=235627 RepID=UPI0008971CF8|nr:MULTISPECIES: hypothetical protein [unclassified Arthrobacter]SDX54825.1 hypothetical protein SAMN04487912_1166 [Arthrobacter sp. cf158]SEJ81712.1 hypothetical protein SAMN04487917_11535 [Arthrobacter sp. yr096]
MEKILVVVAGGIGVIIGVLMITHRASLAKLMSGAQRSTFGTVGDRVAARPSQGMLAVVGAGAILIGAAIIVLVLTRA